MKIYTAGISDKFFKDYINSLDHIAKYAAIKSKEMIDLWNIPDVDKCGNIINNKSKTNPKNK